MVVVTCSFVLFLESGAKSFSLEHFCCSINDVPDCIRDFIDLVIRLSENESCDYDDLSFSVYHVDLEALAEKE